MQSIMTSISIDRGLQELYSGYEAELCVEKMSSPASTGFHQSHSESKLNSCNGLQASPENNNDQSHG